MFFVGARPFRNWLNVCFTIPKCNACETHDLQCKRTLSPLVTKSRRFHSPWLTHRGQGARSARHHMAQSCLLLASSISVSTVRRRRRDHRRSTRSSVDAGGDARRAVPGVAQQVFRGTKTRGHGSLRITSAKLAVTKPRWGTIRIQKRGLCWFVKTECRKTRETNKL